MAASVPSDTIHALASGAPPAGIAVIRVSGRDVPGLIGGWIGRPLEPRRATLVTLRGARDGVPLDRALALSFPAPRSFTGEDVLELHLHGGRAVIAAVEAELARRGSRPAEPGEFTLRAHLNGRIDLIEAERLADLIDAETEAQRAFAASDRGRRNRALYDGWRDTLIEARALIEASLDFADEDDAPVDVGEEVETLIATVAGAVRGHLDGVRSSEIVRTGLRVVLAGAPNAGKSSLLNALARRDVAIVTPEAGTTRDLISVPLDLDGYRVELTDTAGLRGEAGPVERIGIERARGAIASADLVLHLVPPEPEGHSPTVDVSGARLVLATKADLAVPAPGQADMRVSATTGEGLYELLARLRAFARAHHPAPDRLVPLAERHVAHLRNVLTLLDGRGSARDEVLAETLRRAGDELGRITGATDIEAVYDVVFSRFCMGK